MEQTYLEKKIEKLEDKLDSDFKSSVRSVNQSQLKDMIVELSNKIQDIKDAQDADSSLQSAKEQVKDLSSGYRDARKGLKNRLEYILAVTKLSE